MKSSYLEHAMRNGAKIRLEALAAIEKEFEP